MERSFSRRLRTPSGSAMTSEATTRFKYHYNKSANVWVSSSSPCSSTCRKDKHREIETNAPEMFHISPGRLQWASTISDAAFPESHLYPIQRLVTTARRGRRRQDANRKLVSMGPGPRTSETRGGRAAF